MKHAKWLGEEQEAGYEERMEEVTIGISIGKLAAKL